MSDTPLKISFQGAPGANSELACRSAFPDMEPIPCETFEDAFNAVKEAQADYAMIAVDNTLAGRVADVHHLLPDSGLHIIAEHFEPIRHMLLGLPGTKLAQLKDVSSHVHAIPQCRNLIRELGVKTHISADTAGAAQEVSEQKDPTRAAIASSLAADIYGLEILKQDIQDADHNTTRFLILSATQHIPQKQAGAEYITSLIFRVRNIPAALYKGLGGFATNGVNMLKLESYVGPNFQAAQFYADVAGHFEDRALKLALEELAFFASELTLLGTYKAHPFRKTLK